MEFSVVNCRNSNRKALIEAVVSLYMRELKITNSKQTLTISNISGFSKATGWRGAVVKLDDGTLSMAIDSRLTDENLFSTLAHEMVHVKQYAKGQLKPVSRRDGTKSFKWLGRMVNKDYFDCPWELEAFSRERVLSNKITRLFYK